MPPGSSRPCIYRRWKGRTLLCEGHGETANPTGVPKISVVFRSVYVNDAAGVKPEKREDKMSGAKKNDRACENRRPARDAAHK